MKTSSILYQRYLAYAAAAVLLLSAVMPVLITGSADAGQVTSRFVRITSSKVGQTSVTYNFSFNPSTVTGNAADDIKGIVIQFCQNSPLVGVSCTTTNGVTATPADAATVTVNGVAFTADAASNQADLTVLTNAVDICRAPALS